MSLTGNAHLAVKAVAQPHQRSSGSLRQLAQNLHSDLRNKSETFITKTQLSPAPQSVSNNDIKCSFTLD
ncbi:hypothetical protein PBY51_023928 [Eleginops maclovinus]|nr:hypothetical protein PBY51_023928 [Eleginops maclovinus]